MYLNKKKLLFIQVSLYNSFDSDVTTICFVCWSVKILVLVLRKMQGWKT